MKIYFKTKQLYVLYITPLHEIKGKQSLPKEIIKQYKKKVEMLMAMTSIKQFK